MKVRNGREVPKVHTMFTGRKHAREIFWREYEKWIAPSTGDADIQVLSYYGIGGIGKSALLRKLVEELEESRALHVFLDLGMYRESREAMESLRNKLVKVHHFGFPLFDLATYLYARKTGETVHDFTVPAFAGKSPFLSALLEVGQMLPVVGTFAKILAMADRGVAYARTLARKYRPEILSMDAMSEEELYRKLPLFFSLDMKENLSQGETPLVVFLDTYEKMVNETSSLGDPLQNDLWLRGRDGLVQNIPKVLWVIAGRESLKWSHFDPAWNESLTQLRLDSLSYEEAAEFCRQSGIREEYLIDALHRLTRGTPVYLELCRERFSELQATKIPSIEDFEGDSRVLIERYVRDMDDAKKDIVYFLACLGEWDEAAIDAIASDVIPNFSISAYERVKELSIISSSSDGFSVMHRTVADVLFDACPALLRKKATEHALGFHLRRLNASPLFADTLAHDLGRAVHFGLLQYPDDEFCFDFYKRALAETFQKLANAGRLDLFTAAFDPVYRRAMRSGASKLRALAYRVMARLLIFAGKYDCCVPFAEQSVRIFTECSGEDSEDTLESECRLGWGLLRQGKITEAKRKSEIGLQQCRKHSGEMQALTDKFEYLRANTLFLLGNYKDAHEAFLHLRARRSESLGEDHPDTLRAESNIARTLSALGRYDEALRIEEGVWEKRRRLLGDEHPKTVNALNTVGVTLGLLGRYEEAREKKEEVLARRKERWGDEHPETLSAMNTLAGTLRELGRPEEALALKREVVSTLRKTVGEEHPYTLRALHNLAISLEELGQYDESLRIEEEVWEKQRRLLGEAHPDTATALLHWASTLGIVGREEEALAKKRAVLEIRRRVLGEDHPETLLVMNNIAVSLHLLYRYDEALELEKRVWEKRREILGEDHPETLDSRNNWASTLGKLGRTNESLAMKIEVWDQRKERLGEEHPETVNAMSNWAIALGSVGKHEEALKLKREVRRIRKRLYGKDHPDTVDVLNSIAWSLYSSGRAEEGIPYAEKLLAFLSTSELKNQNRIRWLDTVALIFAEVGRLEEAKDIALQILAESEENYAAFDDFMGERYRTAGIVAEKNGERQTALRYFQRAVERYRKTGREKKALEECSARIEKWKKG